MSVFDDLKRCGMFLDALIRSRSDVSSFCGELRAHHEETFFHGYRVALLSVAFGYENRVDEASLSTLAYAGLLHDLGKRCIPVDLIDSPSSLDEGQRRVMGAHPRLGFVLLERFDESVRKVVVAHHEYKKNPYPRSKVDRRVDELIPRSGEERRKPDAIVDSLAQIVAAADIYDALSSRRAYKSSMCSHGVREVMNEQYLGDVKYVEQLFVDKPDEVIGGAL